MKIIKAIFDTITLPVDIVKDIFTIGGIATDEDKTYTRQKIEHIQDDLDE